MIIVDIRRIIIYVLLDGYKKKDISYLRLNIQSVYYVLYD